MELYQRIADFYDSSSGLWERIWGEHMHHGYYGRGGKIKLDRRQAQIDLIEELLTWGSGGDYPFPGTSRQSQPKSARVQYGRTSEFSCG